MEKYFETLPVIVRFFCEDCGEGEMVKPNGQNVALSTYPPRYLHVCNKCGKEELYLKQYPSIEYVPLEKEVFINTNIPQSE